MGEVLGRRSSPESPFIFKDTLLLAKNEAMEFEDTKAGLGNGQASQDFVSMHPGRML